MSRIDYNEAEIGEVFKKTKVPRAEYFVTTKLLGIYSLLS
jgi:diketogulonate reductase-like aldo/keto reductase